MTGVMFCKGPSLPEMFSVRITDVDIHTMRHCCASLVYGNDVARG